MILKKVREGIAKLFGLFSRSFSASLCARPYQPRVVSDGLRTSRAEKIPSNTATTSFAIPSSNRGVFKFLLIIGVFYSFNVHGNAVQLFSGINYDNPAELSQIKNCEWMIGADLLFSKLRFKGVSSGVEGEAVSRTATLLPYGRAVRRFSEKSVASIALTSPSLANIDWGANSLLRYTQTATVGKTIFIAPRYSYKLKKSLAIGAGLDIQHEYINKFDYAVPGLGEVKNHSSGNKVHFDLGAFYTLNSKTFIGLTFYSERTITMKGTSKSDSGLKNDDYKITLNQPQVIHLYCTRVILPKLIISGGVYHSKWSIQKQIKLKNTVTGDLTLDTFWRDTWSFELKGMYDFCEKWSLLFLGMYETRYQRNSFLNSVGYPGSNAIITATGLVYKFCDKLLAQVSYAHVFFDPKSKVDNPRDRGKVSLNGNVLGFRVTYSW